MQSLILDQFVIWPLQQFAKDYEVIGDSIGQGQYGQVFTAKPSKTSCTVTGISRNYSTVAVKFLKCKKASEKLRIRDEIDVLKDMTHDNVVTLLGAYEAQDQFIQILEYLRYC
jgi:serine/threonine protein kinase